MPFVHITTRRLASAMALVVSMALLGPTFAAGDANKPETDEQKLLRIVSTASAQEIRAAYDMDADLIQKIMQHRKAGKTFSTSKEFKDVTGVTPAQVLAILEAEKGGEKSVPRAPGAALAEPRQRTKAMPTGAPAGHEEKTPIVSNIRPGFYGKLPGYDDLDKLEPLIKKEFLERMNYEKCPCGCENETLAYCLVNDPGCPVIKARARKVYEEVVSKSPPKSGAPKE